MATTPKTVLVLHGYAQNASMFSKRLGALRRACGKDVEMVFLDAPLVLQPADLFGDPKDLGAAEATTDAADPSLTPRGWYKAGAGQTSAVGLDQSLLLLRDTLKEKHFDGVFGFSQGAGVAALLAALLENPDRYPPFLVDGNPPHPPLSFCISVAGFKIADPIATTVFRSSYSTPTLHVIGHTDIIVTEERGRALLDLSASPRLEMHDGGHFVPSKANWRKFLAAYLKNPLGDVPSPGQDPASGAATPSASGTATPIPVSAA